MTKRIISLIFAAMLCMVSIVSVSAISKIDHIIDDYDYLYEDEIELLNGEADAIYDEYGIGVFYIYTLESSCASYNIEAVTGDIDNYVAMVENQDSWYIHTAGTAATVIDETAEEYLRSVYDAASTYRSGVSAFFEAAQKVVTANSGSDEGDDTPVVEGDVYIPAGERVLLYDGSDVLTDSEESDLLAKLERISAEYQVDIAVATVTTTGSLSIDKYINEYFDNSGLGVGAERDCVLFINDTEARQFRILSNGKELGAAAITMDVIDGITSNVTSYLKNEDYAGAYGAFADECEYQINGFINGFPFKTGRNLLISLAIGFIVAFIVTGVMKGKLKSVRMQSAASDYVKQGSLNLVDSRDIFLYSRVTKTQKSSSSSGSSGGSGGSSRNVGGGSY